MKLKSIKYISYLLLCSTLLLYSCYKTGGDVNISEVLDTGAYLEFNQARVTAASPIPLSYTTIATAAASIKVKLNIASKPVDSVVIYEGASINRSTWKRIKAVAFKDSGTLTVSGAEIAAARGVAPTALSIGTNFTFYNELVTSDGKRFSMANTATEFESPPDYKMAMRWFATVFCNYNNTVFNGLFKVVTDGWQDFNTGELIAVSSPVNGDANKVQIIAYPAPAFGINRKPIILTVNPATNNITVPFQIYGDYPGFADNLGVTGSGSLNSCSGTISVSLTHRIGSVTGQAYGPYTLTLQK